MNDFEDLPTTGIKTGEQIHWEQCPCGSTPPNGTEVYFAICGECEELTYSICPDCDVRNYIKNRCMHRGMSGDGEIVGLNHECGCTADCVKYLIQFENFRAYMCETWFNYC